MKIKSLILLLLFFSNLDAQINFDTAKLKNYSIVVENKFILKNNTCFAALAKNV